MAPFEVRRLTAADRPALSAEVGRARAAGEFRASSDDEGLWLLKSFDVDPGMICGAFDAGDLLGFVSLDFKIVVVRPERRRQGIGRALVEIALVREQSRGREIAILGVLPDDATGKAFLAATGFTYHSMLWDLALPPDTPIVAPVWPADATMRPFDRSRDAGSWLELFNAAFADHATPLQLDATFITAGLHDPAIADADTGLVVDKATGELVGFCATSPIRRDGVVADHGEIWTIGVRPGRQGTGLGRQLLRWGVAYLRGLGVGHASLSVNARNERALGLYESEGFVRSRTRERWSHPVARTEDGEGSP